MSNVSFEPLVKKAEVVRGVTFSKRDAINESREGYLPVLRAGNIQASLLLEDGLVFVPKRMISEQQLIQPGDIVMCTSSGSSTIVGKTAYSYEKWEGSFGAFCAVVRPKSADCDPRYLYHYLQSPAFRHWTENSSGANIKNIRKSELEALDIPFPSLDAQRRIAAILDKADAIRRKREQAIEMANDLLKSTFLEMFGNLSVNSKNWDCEILGDHIVHSNNGISRRRKALDNIGQIVLRLQDVRKNDIEYEDCNRIALDRSEQQRFQLAVGDLLFVRVNGNRDYVGRCAIFLGYSESVYHNDHLIRLRMGPKFDPFFLSFLFNMQVGRSLLSSSIKTSAGQYTISQGGLKTIEFPTPPLALQKKFREFSEQVNLAKVRLSASYDEASDLFGSLSQQAFKGEL